MLVGQSCQTVCNPIDSICPWDSFKAKILEWVAISFSRVSSQARSRSWVSPALQADYLLSHQISPILRISSVKFSCLVVSDALRPHGLLHTRLPCLSPTPGDRSNLCPSSRWCHRTIWSSFVPFSSCLQSFASSGSLPVSQFFASSGQSIGMSASESVLLMNIQDWFPLGWLVGSPCSPRDSQESYVVWDSTQFKTINSLALSFLYGSKLTSVCDHWKNHSFN